MNLVTSDRKKSSRFNWTLFAMVILLLTIGLINLYSALSIWGGDVRTSLFWSQIMWVSIGLAFMIFLAFFDYRLIERASLYIYIFSIILLVAVLFFGKVVAGHRSWLSIGGFALQPSEFAKLALVIFMAKYFSHNPYPEGSTLSGFWRPILYSAIPALLVALQGDLGSAMFFVLIFATFSWFGRLRGRGVTILITAAVLGAVVFYFFGLSDYQKNRITNFVDPEADPRGSGYHVIQSKIAVGSGELFGKGYRKGNVNKLKYLPEKHTDFIFPVFAEEWGFAGCISVLFLYYLLFLSGIKTARKSRDRTGLFLSLGVMAFIFWQVVINLGGVLGLMPLTGVTLPFLSYGGSSTIVTLGSMGIIFSVGMRRFLF